jgi:uncharacterized protein (TIGR00730 family)
MNKRVAIFSGSECLVKEKNQYYFDLAYKTGKLLAEAGFTVITGAGPGLMDEALRGAKEAGGHTIGIVLNLPNRYQSIHVEESTVFDKLGPRQDKMIEMADAYFALPGGIGTVYEIFNILALKRINEMPVEKPLILIDGYYQSAKDLIENIIQSGFVSDSIHSFYDITATPDEAVKKISIKLN